MDTDADVRAHLAWDGQYTMLVGGRGNGTLIGAVARDRRVNGCLDATALAASLQGLLSGIHPTDPTVPPPPTLKPVPLPGRE